MNFLSNIFKLFHSILKFKEFPTNLISEERVTEGFFPVTPDLPRRGNSSQGIGQREYQDPIISSTLSRKSTGNIRSLYRPRDNIAMAGNMDLTTVTQESVGAGVGGFRSASVKPR